MSHQRTSWHLRHENHNIWSSLMITTDLRYQTLRSSWEQRTMWPAASWRRTRNHPQQPDNTNMLQWSWWGSVVYLVSSAYQVKIMFMKELGYHLSSEGEGDSSVVLPPAHGVLVRVWPEQVAEQPLVRNISGSHDTSKYQQHQWVYNGGQCQHVCENIFTSPHLICSMLWRSGDSPPWQQKIFSSTMAATGRQLKQSVKVFHNLMLYLLLHSS